MKFWLSKNGEISLREQLARQIILAIISSDLPPHAKLPSVREMALRYDIHPNTVSQTYGWLAERDWVEARAGSGVFVKEKSRQEIETVISTRENELDLLIKQFLQNARERGFNAAEIGEKINQKLRRKTFDEIVLLEKDAELRRILRFEIQNQTDLPIFETDSIDFKKIENAIVVALEEMARQIPDDLPHIALRLNSVQNEMRDKQRPASSDLIGIASRLELFLSWSKMMLVAAGIAPEQIIIRDAKNADWDRGLTSCAFVICDSLTAQNLPKSARVRVFRLIAAESLAELRNLT